MDLANIANESLAILLGGVAGGISNAYFAWRMLRADTARRLLAEALSIQSEKEAWVLDGGNVETLKLTDLPNLPTSKIESKPWLRCVEVRAVLDEERWTVLSNQCYGFIEGRRVWIVRNHVLNPRAYNGGLRDGWHQALLSSRAIENLCGWLEQVVICRRGLLLRKHELATLRPLLLSICTKDRREVFGNRISKGVHTFLEKYAEQNSIV